jgi:hypothetical protein
MSYRTILVHCDASKSVWHRLNAAADLAERFGAHLVGLHLRQPFDTPVLFDGGVVMNDFLRIYEEGVKADEATASAAFEGHQRKHLSTEWWMANGYPENEVALQEPMPTLVVLGQAEPGATATPSDLP